MQVEIILRKFGNSTEAVLPPSVLNALGLRAGQYLTVEATPDGGILLTPKRKYTLTELVAQCNFKAKSPVDVAEWSLASPVGHEVI